MKKFKLIIVKASYSDASDTAMYFNSYEEAKQAENRLKSEPFNHIIFTKIMEVENNV